MGDLRVDHQQDQPGRFGLERDEPDALVPAVEEDGVVLGAAQRGGLVHDAGGGSDEVVLGALGGQDHFLVLQPGARQVVEGGDDGALDGVGRGEPGAEGNVGIQQQVQARAPRCRAAAAPR